MEVGGIEPPSILSILVYIKQHKSSTGAWNLLRDNVSVEVQILSPRFYIPAIASPTVGLLKETVQLLPVE